MILFGIEDYGSNNYKIPRKWKPFWWTYADGELERRAGFDILYLRSGSDKPQFVDEPQPCRVKMLRNNEEVEALLYLWKPSNNNLPRRGLVVLPDDKEAVEHAELSMKQKKEHL
jgi:hypothetical protein